METQSLERTPTIARRPSSPERETVWASPDPAQESQILIHPFNGYMNETQNLMQPIHKYPKYNIPIQVIPLRDLLQ